LLQLRFTPKWASEFFLNLVKDTVQYREENDVTKNDFLQLLMQLMRKGYVEDADSIKLSKEEREMNTGKTTKHPSSFKRC
jgi:cytochrome P450 family 6